MFSHVMLGCSDRERSRKFYNATMEALGHAPLRPLYATMRRMLTFLDAPDHTRMRRLANRGFTRPAIEGWRADIEAQVNALFDRRHASGAMDVIADLARPLPLAMISRLLGMGEADTPALARWSNAMGRFFGRFSQMDEDDYIAAVKARLRSEEDIYETMLRDTYQNGIVLARRKYRYLAYAYRLFVVGLTLTFLAFGFEMIMMWSG